MLPPFAEVGILEVEAQRGRDLYSCIPAGSLQELLLETLHACWDEVVPSPGDVVLNQAAGQLQSLPQPCWPQWSGITEPRSMGHLNGLGAAVYRKVIVTLR